MDALSSLKTTDLYSMILFALFQLRDEPKYSTLSELAYILDETHLLSLCKYYGGMEIKIPTLEEIETIIYALELYNFIDIHNGDISESILKLRLENKKQKEVISTYNELRELLKEYEFNSR